MKFPRADEPDHTYGGWTIDPHYIDKIYDKCDGVVRKPLIEMILLAVEMEEYED